MGIPLVSHRVFYLSESDIPPDLVVTWSHGHMVTDRQLRCGGRGDLEQESGWTCESALHYLPDK